MQRIRITNAEEWNWYRVGDIFFIKDADSYKPIGVQVYKDGNGSTPDVVAFGDFEYLD